MVEANPLTENIEDSMPVVAATITNTQPALPTYNSRKPVYPSEFVTKKTRL